MSAILKIFSLISLFIILISCNKTSTEPEPQSGRRDYNWTSDTLKPGFESLTLVDIWGSNSSNIWAVGNSSWTATKIWHFNGTQWRCDSLSRAVVPFGVFGLASNEVWLGNANNTIWKFDGSSWLKYGEYKISGYNQTVIQGFDGLTTNHIFGVGLVLNNDSDKKAAILFYNGSTWSFVNIPVIKVHFENVAIDTGSGILVISGMEYNSTGFIAKIYSWDGTELKELLSEHGLWSYVCKVGGEIYCTIDSKIYRYSNKQLILWKNNLGTSVTGELICGRSRNDFFIKDKNGIAHFNGSDFQVLYATNFTIMGGTIFEKDAFFIGHNYSTGKNIVIHGQLK